MMARHEAAVGRRFGLVVRLRPDLCMRSTSVFLHFAMRRIDENPDVAFFSSDGVAAMPRWTADAYSEFWRAHGRRCVLPPAWQIGTAAGASRPGMARRRTSSFLPRASSESTCTTFGVETAPSPC